MSQPELKEKEEKKSETGAAIKVHGGDFSQEKSETGAAIKVHGGDFSPEKSETGAASKVHGGDFSPEKSETGAANAVHGPTYFSFMHIKRSPMFRGARPDSEYNQFKIAESQKIRKEFPGMESTDIMKKVGKRWSENKKRHITDLERIHKRNCGLGMNRQIEAEIRVKTNNDSAEIDKDYQYNAEIKPFENLKNNKDLDTYKEIISIMKDDNIYNEIRLIFIDDFFLDAKESKIFEEIETWLLSEEEKDNSGWIAMHLFIYYSSFNDYTDTPSEYSNRDHEHIGYLRSRDIKRYKKAEQYLNIAVSKNNISARMEFALMQFSIMDRYRMYLKIAEETNYLPVKKIISGIEKDKILDEEVYKAMAKLWHNVVDNYDGNSAYQLLTRIPEGIKLNGKQFRTMKYNKDVLVELSIFGDNFCDCIEFHRSHIDYGLNYLYMKCDIVKSELPKEEGKLELADNEHRKMHLPPISLAEIPA